MVGQEEDGGHVGDKEGKKGGGKKKAQRALGQGKKPLGEPKPPHPLGHHKKPREHHQKLPVHPEEEALGAEPAGEEEEACRHHGPLGHGVGQEEGHKKAQGHQKPLAEKGGVDPGAHRGQGREGPQAPDLGVEEGEEEDLEGQAQEGHGPQRCQKAQIGDPREARHQDVLGVAGGGHEASRVDRPHEGEEVGHGVQVQGLEEAEEEGGEEEGHGVVEEEGGKPPGPEGEEDQKGQRASGQAQEPLGGQGEEARVGELGVQHHDPEEEEQGGGV